MISIKAHWERWCRWNCDLRVINAHKKRHFLSYRKHCHDAQIMWPYAYYVTLGSHCKMANLSSEDETDTLPYIAVSVWACQAGFWKSAGTSCQLRSKPHAVLLLLKCSLHKWAWCSAARKSAHLNCINLIHFCLTVGRLCWSSCIVIPGVISELLQFVATQ